MDERILIFPGGMPRSLAFLDQAISEGKDVVGSSSLKHDPASKQYTHWFYLPFITNENFLAELINALSEFNITGIYTPNPVVWNFLNDSIQKGHVQVSLVNHSPLSTETEPYKKALEFADSLLKEQLNFSAFGSIQPDLSRIAIAALFRHSDLIPGMCDHDKIRATYNVFRCAPPGDVVEIGSWWGKSAFVFNWLARSYSIGNVLCVDPWSEQNLVQNDSTGLVDKVIPSTEDAFNLFQINLLPYSNGSFNYYRLPSSEASIRYRTSTIVSSSTFGHTEYTGTISILHIDGNHSYENVSEDIEAWSAFVLPGGWIILDDYVWPYGNGPMLSGDEFICKNQNRIHTSFVMGSALFIQLRG